MTKELLIHKISTETYDKQKLLAWVGCLPRLSVNPSENAIGDVYMHKVFKHPYVLLKKKGSIWICGLLTSSGNCPEILEECNSRFFGTSYITKTMFTASVIEGDFMGIFDNTAQLKRVYRQLLEIFAK